MEKIPDNYQMSNESVDYLSLSLYVPEKNVENENRIDLYYELCDDADINQRLSALLNESCHVYLANADDDWDTVHKPKYVEMYAAEIKARPSLVSPLLDLRDRIVSNLTHAAMKLNEKTT